MGFGIGGSGKAGGATAFLYLNAASFSKGLAKSAGELDAFFKTTSAAGAAGAAGPLQRVTNVASKVAVAGAAIIGSSLAAFVQFDKAMTNVFSIMDATDAQMTKTTETVRALSVELGKSPTELADGLYEIAQAGYDAEQATTLLDTAARAATAGLTTVNAAAKPLIAVLQGYGLGVEKATEVSDKLFVGVTQGIFSFEELSTQIGDNVPLAHALGVSLDDLVTSYIVLTKQGNSLSESTTQLNGVMNALLKPSDKLTELLQKMGFASGEDILAAKGLIGTVKALQEQFNLTDSQLAELFPNIRGLRGEIGLLNVSDEELVKTQAQVANSAGTTAEVLAKQQKSVAFQIAQVREAIRGAAIDLGGTFAPAVLAIAKQVGALAQAFSNLDPYVRNAIGGVVLFATGAATTILVIAQVASSVVKLIEVMQTLQRTIGLVNLATMITGWGALIVVLGVVAELYLRHRQASKESEEALNRQKEAVDRLESSYDGLKKKIDELLIQNKFGLGAEAQNQLDRIDDTVNKVSTDYADMGAEINRLQDLLKPEGLVSPYFADAAARAGGFDKAVQSVKDQITFLKKEQSDLGSAMDVGAKATDVYSAALSDERINLDAVTMALNFLLDGYANHSLTAPVVIAQLDDMSTHMSRYRTETEKSTEQLQADEQATEELVKAKQALSDAMDTLIDTTAATVAGKPGEDLVSWMRGVQQGLIRTGDSTAKLINRMKHQQIGKVLDFDPSIQEAVEMVRRVERVDEGITKLSDSISQNTDDISMWQSRIGLVTDTLGGNTDSLDQWITWLDDGAVTQEQFNAAVESGAAGGAFEKLDALYASGAIGLTKYQKAQAAGNFLIERSVGGIRDETEAQIDNIIQMAAFVKEHDAAEGAIRGATDAQLGFIAALESGSVQANIQTLQTLAYLAAIEAIPAEKVTNFILNASQDEATRAVFEQMGLITIDKKTGEITVNVDFKKGDSSEVDEQLGDLTGGPVNVPTELGKPDDKNVTDAKDTVSKGTPATIPTEFAAPTTGPAPPNVPAAAAPAAAAPLPVAPPQNVVTNVDVVISSADTAALDHIYGQITNWVPTVTTAFTFTGGIGGGESAASGSFEVTREALINWTKTVTTTFDFVPDVEFQPTFDALYTAGTAAQANLDILKGTLHTTFVAIATDASNLGLAAGSGFKTNFTSGVDGASLAANAEQGEVRGQLTFSLYGEGSSAGGSFVSGFANAITSGWIGAYTAAYQLGQSAKQGVQDAIKSGSPSREAMLLGENFAQSLAMGMLNQETAVSRQSASLGNAMKAGVFGTMGGGKVGAATINSVISGSARPQLLMQQHNYALSASDLQQLLAEADTGASFARGFTRELDVRRG